MRDADQRMAVNSSLHASMVCAFKPILSHSIFHPRPSPPNNPTPRHPMPKQTGRPGNSFIDNFKDGISSTGALS